MRTLVILLAICVVTAVGQDKGKGKGKGGGGIPAPVVMKIAAFSDGGPIPAKYGCVGGQNTGVSPAMTWSGAPQGVATYAIILHDPDVMFGTDDVLHWAIFNIPGASTSLPEGVPNKATLDDGSVQINNIGGTAGYFNPCPPAPTNHHYVFEIYALDTKLDLQASATRADIMKALGGHVRAKGIYFGLYHQ
jgi:Raf kinase inhibitor-like YbhB/YbcL family protein